MASIIDKPNKPNNWWNPPVQKPAGKKVLAQPVKPQIPPPNPGQYEQQPKSNLPTRDYFGYDDVGKWLKNWLLSIGSGTGPDKSYDAAEYLAGNQYSTLPHGNTIGEVTPWMQQAALGQSPVKDNYFQLPGSGVPKSWQIAPVRGASRDDQPYNPQQAYYAYSPERIADPDNIAWANRNREKNTPWDYFDRIAINGRGYSVPNQMLNFTDTGGVWPWEPMPSWYEPPPGAINSNDWKEWRDGEGGSYGEEPVGGTGGGGGGGYGYGGWSGGYGSSNYDSKPAYPTQGYKQDPNIYYQQLVKWVI